MPALIGVYYIILINLRTFNDNGESKYKFNLKWLHFTIYIAFQQ